MKKRVLIALVVLLALAATASVVWADKPTGFDQKGNETSWANSNAFDTFGYNYQGHIFSGRYCDYDRVIGGDYCDVDLIMKWSDVWLSNVDSNSDGKLDRGYVDCRGDGTNPGLTESHCPGAWLTNHQKGEYELDGKICKWTYFVKIAYVVPEGDLWGAFTVIQSVNNDPCAGFHGIEELIQPAGFGAYK